MQFAVLQALEAQPGVDQKTLAHLVSFDTSTIGAVIDRLEAKALLTRSLSPEDRRVRLLNLTPAGQAMLEHAGGATHPGAHSGAADSAGEKTLQRAAVQAVQ